MFDQYAKFVVAVFLPFAVSLYGENNIHHIQLWHLQTALHYTQILSFSFGMHSVLSPFPSIYLDLDMLPGDI